MNVFRVSRGCVVTALAMLGISIGWNSAAFAQQVKTPALVPAVDGVEVLVRGPVHEAFAQTVTFNPEPGIVAPKAPPEMIEEVAPDQRPTGDNVAWIPGYWAWDAERDDYLWVSGIWRSLPPGRQWVPGYWNQADNSVQWTSGYWADAKLTENVYLPEPPDTVESGPNIDAPSADHIWTPGCWVWNENRYAWRPGYWVAAQQNWMWVPAQYVWSPRGYVFVDGYYDYSVARRGVLYAPVYFNPSVYSQQGYRYSPVTAISLAVFGNQLFLRPNYNHYYFGDYYGSGYSTAGYYPWFSFNNGRRGYDPFYAHQRWHHRNDRDWQQRIETDFQRRNDNEEARPPRSLAAQQTLLKEGDTTNVTQSLNNVIVATTLAQLATSKESSLRLQPVTNEEQKSLTAHVGEVNQFRAARQKMEVKTSDAAGEQPAKDSAPARVKLPKSPILATTSGRLDKENTPPKSQRAPAPDTKIEPKPRQANANRDSPKTGPIPIKAAKPVLPEEKPKRAQNDTKGESKPGPKGEPKVEPKPAPRVEPKSERPRVEPKDQPRPTPNVEPKSDPKPIPKVDPVPERPRSEPKVNPKSEPRSTPKANPKPAPKAEPKVEPKPSPRAEPKPDRPKTEPKQ